MKWRVKQKPGLLVRNLPMQPTSSAESDLKMHARLLQAVNEIATHLIAQGPETFHNAVLEALKIIGTAVNVDRAYLWENFEQDGLLYSRQIYEWSEKVTPQEGESFTVATPYSEVPYWLEAAESRRAINGPIRRLPDEERMILEPQGIKSILMIPLYLNNRFWGFIGFDDCQVERTFSRTMEQVLESAGILIVSSIERNKMTQLAMDAWADVSQHEKLLHAANRIAHLLLETDEESFESVIRQTLKTLSDYAGADRVSIWRNLHDDNGAAYSKRLSMYLADQSINDEQPSTTLDFETCIPGWYNAQYDINGITENLNPSLQNTGMIVGSKSVTLLPITIHGECWGFIAFVHMRDAYLYSETQIGILRSSGMLIASGVIRENILRNLVEARENALASARSKSEFLSRMSHEIRTPMNAIIGMTALAKKSGDLSMVKRYLDTVDTSSRQLLSIINDVLDMSKIDANRLEIVQNAFDFDDMLRHVLDVMQVKLSEKRLNLKLDVPQTFSRMVVSDELRLSQILINLMSNAVKFTPPYGAITLKASETPLEGDRSILRMEVADTGIGIAGDRLSHVFEAFEQGDGSVTRQYGGTGLGLAISKRIAHLMHGDLTAESELNKGSRFTLEVPVEWGKSLHRTVGSHAIKRHVNVLVVDDAPDVLEYFRHILRQFGQRCDTASSGEQALTLVASQTYDVIFLDWFMPGMGGAETAIKIRRIMDGNAAAMVLISSSDWADIEKEAVSAGLTQYLHKPVLPSDLYNKLAELTTTPVPESALAAGLGNAPVGGPKSALYDWHRHCILLAEDVEINREIIAGILDETGITIDYACDGQEVVDMFARNPERYALIFMDVQMPVMDGYNATRLIRQSGLPRATEIPIIAMTANAFKEDEESSYAAGMNGHISKPIDVNLLMKVLQDVLKD